MPPLVFVVAKPVGLHDAAQERTIRCRLRAHEGALRVRPHVEKVEGRTHVEGLAIAGQRQVHCASAAVAAALGDVAQVKEFGLWNVGVESGFRALVFKIGAPLDEVVDGALRAIAVVDEEIETGRPGRTLGPRQGSRGFAAEHDLRHAIAAHGGTDEIVGPRVFRILQNSPIDGRQAHQRSGVRGSGRRRAHRQEGHCQRAHREGVDQSLHHGAHSRGWVRNNEPRDLSMEKPMGIISSRAAAALLCGFAVLLVVAPGRAAAPEDLPAGAQARSLSGQALYAAQPSKATLEKLAAARRAYEADPESAEAIIWYGRRTAYAGDYRRAIEIFSEGIDRFPLDPRFYRHRGHRYISTRQFERAIDDFLRASVLMRGLDLQVEPDGLPNAQNIPLTTTQGNVWYHLGLAAYLRQDWPLALAAFRNGYRLGGNDDNLVSTGHWIYMILRRMGREEEAAEALADIQADMNIIENTSYHRLCLLYRGELEVDALLEAGADDPSNAAVAYGVANYFYYNGDRARSDEFLKRIVNGSAWSAFGYIAAEADLADPDRS